MIVGMLGRQTTEQKITHGTKQAYIALGVLLAAAAEMGIDACPMEGFDAAQFDEILGLKDLGFNICSYCANRVPLGGRYLQQNGQGTQAQRGAVYKYIIKTYHSCFKPAHFVLPAFFVYLLNGK